MNALYTWPPLLLLRNCNKQISLKVAAIPWVSHSHSTPSVWLSLYFIPSVWLSLNQFILRVIKLSSPTINNWIAVGCALGYLAVVLNGLDGRLLTPQSVSVMCSVSCCSESLTHLHTPADRSSSFAGSCPTFVLVDLLCWVHLTFVFVVDDLMCWIFPVLSIFMLIYIKF